MSGVQTLAKALVHPIRERALRELAEARSLSPSMIASTLGCPLGVVSYHVRQLAELGVVRETRRVQRRGAVEHFYAITQLGQDALRMADSVPQNNLRSQQSRK